MNSVSSFLQFAIVPAACWFSFQLFRRMPQPWRFAIRALALFLAIASTLCLVISLPAGSVDISDLWLFLRFGLAPFLLLMALRLVIRARAKWVRLAAAGTLSILLFTASLLFLLLCLAEAGCTKRAAPLYSPNGNYVALLEFGLQGALGDDYGRVALRHTWWPFAEIVYSGLGDWNAGPNRQSSPKIKWVDNSNLQIRYWDNRRANGGRGGPAICKTVFESVHITCENDAVKNN